MILRSVTKHVKDQNWFAVVLDLVIVVVGVFIGIQVANLNDEQKEKLIASEYVERIQEDLSANEKDLRNRIQYYQRLNNHALGALSALSQPVETLEQQFLIDIYQASNSLPRQLGRDSYDEILSIGALNTITNIDIRQRLAQYYRHIKTSEYFFLNIPEYRDKLRSLMPHEVQSDIRKTCRLIFNTDETGAPNIVFTEKCDLGVTQYQVSNAVAIVHSSNIKPYLTRVLADFELKLQLFQVVINRSEELRAYLRETK
jgi:DNA-directed RNA polymerase delta subunit